MAGPAAQSGRLPDHRRARTATSGWSSWPPASGAGCGPGWGSPRHTRTPSSTPSPSGSRSGARSARCSRSSSPSAPWTNSWSAGQSHGVPIAAVLEPSAVMHADHFQAVGAMTDAELVPGVRTSVPVGYFVVDGQQVGFRTPAPAAGADEPRWHGPAPHRPGSGCGRWRPGRPVPALFRPAHRRPRHHRRRRRTEPAVRRPGRRGHQGGERGVSRRSAAGQAGQVMSESFAWTHRNNLGLGLDLRSPAGADVFSRLVGRADAVFANFKPGTLAGLGFSYEKLRSAQSADRARREQRLRRHRAVECADGLRPVGAGQHRCHQAVVVGGGRTGGDRHPFFDATTVFPDHVVGRITAIGALAGADPPRAHRRRRAHPRFAGRGGGSTNSTRCS